MTLPVNKQLPAQKGNGESNRRYNKEADQKKHARRLEREEQKRGQIKNFSDPNNEYLSIITKRIRALTKKLKQCEIIEKKIECGKELHTEQLAAIENKSNIKFTISEFEKILLQAKEFALREKENEKLQSSENNKLQKKKENEEKKAMQKKTDKAISNALKEKEIAEKTLKDSIVANIEADNAKMNELFKLFQIIHFLDCLNENETRKISQEIATDPSLTNGNFTDIMDGLVNVRLFGKKLRGSSINAPCDNLISSIKLANKYLEQSDESIEGIPPNYSFKTIFSLVSDIFQSSLYNKETFPESKLFMQQNSFEHQFQPTPNNQKCFADSDNSSKKICVDINDRSEIITDQTSISPKMNHFESPIAPFVNPPISNIKQNECLLKTESQDVINQMSLAQDKQNLLDIDSKNILWESSESKIAIIKENEINSIEKTRSIETVQSENTEHKRELSVNSQTDNLSWNSTSNWNKNHYQHGRGRRGNSGYPNRGTRGGRPNRRFGHGRGYRRGGRYQQSNREIHGSPKVN